MDGNDQLHPPAALLTEKETQATTVKFALVEPGFGMGALEETKIVLLVLGLNHDSYVALGYIHHSSTNWRRRTSQVTYF
jgi:hypothetical protein